jgi:hypothetical protein
VLRHPGEDIRRFRLTFSLRDFGFDLDSSIEKIPFFQGIHAGRGVARAREVFFPGFDHQAAVFDAGIFLTPFRVVLGLLVSDEADLIAPDFGIGGAAIVEFLGPDELQPSGRLLRRT